MAEYLAVSFSSNDPRRRRAIEALMVRAGVDVSGLVEGNTAAAISYGTALEARVTLPDHDLFDNLQAWNESTSALLRIPKEERPSKLFQEVNGRFICQFDLPAIFFGLLRRWEETISSDRDEHGRWPFRSSLVSKFQLAHTAFADELAREFGRIAAQACGVQKKKSIWNGGEWACALTFDIDSAAMFCGRAAVGNLRRLFREGGTVSAAKGFSTAIAVSSNLRPDPHHNLDLVGDRLNDLGIPSTFFVQAVKAHRLDNYSLQREQYLIRALRRLRQRGHEIGLHGSYSTIDGNEEKLKHQRRVVEKLIGGSVRLHRHHYLRCAAPNAFSIYSEAGIGAECSAGFSEQEGFRLGTAFPVKVNDSLHTIPVHVMDVTLRYHRGMNARQAREAAITVMQECRRVNGLCVLLWHPHNLESLLWQGWEDTPFQLAQWAKENGARMDTLGNLFDIYAAHARHFSFQVR